MRVLLGCVAENNDLFLAQALRLVMSVRWFGGSLANADLMVGVVEGDGGAYAAELQALGAVVRPMARANPRLPRGNKISLFEQPEIDDYEVVLFLDCDTIVVQDPAPYLSASEFRAKIADAPTVPQATLDRLCRLFGLPQPAIEYATTSDLVPTSWYINAGVMNIPVRLVDEIVPLWRYYMDYLGDHPEHFAEQFHCSQGGLALGYQTHRVNFAEWPVTMNFPLHLTHFPPTPAMQAGDPIILHYHTLIDPAGALLPTVYPQAQARVEQFNARLHARLASGWRYPSLTQPAVSVEPPSVVVAVPSRASGTVLVEVDTNPSRLRERLEELYQAGRQSAPSAILVSHGPAAPEVGDVIAGLGLALPVVAVHPGAVGASLDVLRRHIPARRVGFLAHDASFSPPAWVSVPETGDALLPWLPTIPVPADQLQPPGQPACGWLAPAAFLEQLAHTHSLADWTLWALADQGIAGRKLDWLAAPVADPLPGARPVRGTTRRLTRASTVLAVVPHYNCHAYLAQALEGLLHQTRPPDGILVVDDGSDQSPADIVRQYPGVSLWNAPRNAGTFRVLQAVIDLTHYDAYLQQDADDWSTIDRLALFLAEAERTGAEMIGSQEVRLWCDQQRVTPGALPLDVNLAVRLQPTGLPILLGTSLISRDLLMRLGGYATGLPLSVDTELARRAVYAARVVNAPYYAYFRRKRPGSITTHPNTRAGSDASQASQAIAHGRSLLNKALVASGAAPNLVPPKLAAHVALKHSLGPAPRPAPGAPALHDPPTLASIGITGMHRAGTSMVARLLNLCGLYLGPEDDLPRPGPDNPEGHWENFRFVQINDRLLAALQAGWDLPPHADDLAARLSPERWPDEQALAGALISQMSQHPWWGWKDPRSALTLPFWSCLIPDLRFVICLRHPLEIAASLHARGTSSAAFALNLWQAYYERLLAGTAPDRRLVTHYDSYFHDAPREIRRVLAACGLQVPDAVVERAAATVARHLRHHSSPPDPMPTRIAELYARLCAEAGPVFALAQASPSHTTRPAAAVPAAGLPTGAVPPAPASDHMAWQNLLRDHQQQASHLREAQVSLAAHAQQLAELNRELAVARHEVQALHRAKLVRAAFVIWGLLGRTRQLIARLRAAARRVRGTPPERRPN